MATKAKKAKKRASSSPPAHPADAKTIVSFLLDETQSMHRIMGATLEGFNTYVSDLKRTLAGSEVYFSLVTFNSRRTCKVHVGAALHEVALLTEKTYSPGGYTPLIDACAKTILATEEVERQHPGAKVLVVFQTDGEENSSSEFTREQLRQMISAREEGGWRFAFIGAGIDSYLQAQSIGIAAASTVSYDGVRASKGLFGSLSQSTALYASSATGSAVRSVGMSWSGGEKMALGDTFASNYVGAGTARSLADIAKDDKKAAAAAAGSGSA